MKGICTNCAHCGEIGGEEKCMEFASKNGDVDVVTGRENFYDTFLSAHFVRAVFYVTTGSNDCPKYKHKEEPE